jgi:hypothetical protein
MVYVRAYLAVYDWLYWFAKLLERTFPMGLIAMTGRKWAGPGALAG